MSSPSTMVRVLPFVAWLAIFAGAGMVWDARPVSPSESEMSAYRVASADYSYRRVTSPTAAGTPPEKPIEKPFNPTMGGFGLLVVIGGFGLLAMRSLIGVLAGIAARLPVSRE